MKGAPLTVFSQRHRSIHSVYKKAANLLDSAEVGVKVSQEEARSHLQRSGAKLLGELCLWCAL